jgi:hypothetical protein
MQYAISAIEIAGITAESKGKEKQGVRRGRESAHAGGTRALRREFLEKIQ